MIRYAFSYLQYSSLRADDLALLLELMAMGFAIAAFLLLLRVIWRLLRAVVRSIAALLSWGIAVATIAFLLVRFFRFFG